MDLGPLSQRLAQHFRALACEREDTPVFALEHGLAPAERLALQLSVRDSIRNAEPQNQHRLAWNTGRPSRTRRPVGGRTAGANGSAMHTGTSRDSFLAQPPQDLGPISSRSLPGPSRTRSCPKTCNSSWRAFCTNFEDSSQPTCSKRPIVWAKPLPTGVGIHRPASRT